MHAEHRHDGQQANYIWRRSQSPIILNYSLLNHKARTRDACRNVLRTMYGVIASTVNTAGTDAEPKLIVAEWMSAYELSCDRPTPPVRCQTHLQYVDKMIDKMSDIADKRMSSSNLVVMWHPRSTIYPELALLKGQRSKS